MATYSFSREESEEGERRCGHGSHGGKGRGEGRRKVTREKMSRRGEGTAKREEQTICRMNERKEGEEDPSVSKGWREA